MKRIVTNLSLGTLLSLIVSLSGCIKPEAPNAEADILSCIVGEDLLFRKVVVTNDAVEITVNSWVNVEKLAPVFILTEGATIAPGNGILRDFTHPQTYTITSQDGQWSKEYQVKVTKPSLLEQPVWNYSFEGVRYDGKMPIIQELDSNGEVLMEWATGNEGGKLLAIGMPGANTFCTTQDPKGYKGKSVKLETISTGFFGKLMKTPIATGSLFIGSFDKENMVKAPLKATRFGKPFRQIPHSLEGYYKYRPGKEVTDKDSKVVKDAVDNFSLYAVFFETNDQVEWLDGSNVLTSQQLIAVAQLTERHASEEWVHFSIPFVLKPGKQVDLNKLKAGKYNYSIIAASSEQGGDFTGAVGSTLWLDELKLYCQ